MIRSFYSMYFPEENVFLPLDASTSAYNPTELTPQELINISIVSLTNNVFPEDCRGLTCSRGPLYIEEAKKLILDTVGYTPVKEDIHKAKISLSDYIGYHFEATNSTALMNNVRFRTISNRFNGEYPDPKVFTFDENIVHLLYSLPVAGYPFPTEPINLDIIPFLRKMRDENLIPRVLLDRKISSVKTSERMKSYVDSYDYLDTKTKWVVFYLLMFYPESMFCLRKLSEFPESGVRFIHLKMLDYLNK